MMKVASKYYFKLSKTRNVNKFLTAENKIQIIYDGVEQKFIKHSENIKAEDVQQKYILPSHYLLYLSTVEPRKNIQLLLKTFEKIRTHMDIPPELVIAERRGWKVENHLNDISEECKQHILYRLLYTRGSALYFANDDVEDLAEKLKLLLHESTVKSRKRNEVIS